MNYWIAGFSYKGQESQLERFLGEGIWDTGEHEPKIGEMKPGDKIALKASYTRKHQLPFDIGGKTASVMRFEATGTITEVEAQESRVKVDWQRFEEPRYWYFFTFRTALTKLDTSHENSQALIRFLFEGDEQDINDFLKQPYWAEKYFSDDGGVPDGVADEGDSGHLIVPYTVDDIIDEGAFFERDFLQDAVGRLRQKKNVILQGPPGTGKTWLAKRLAKALIESAEPLPGQVRSVQFHPTLSYEDFVGGLRPNAEGSLDRVDGTLLEAIKAAAESPDEDHVLVIEEINRGNPAQIFGEMLTLIEGTKRTPEEAMQLSYKRKDALRTYVPDNLYIIGTMNVADRSLAMVDFALRRRFGFVTLDPQFNDAWHQWCLDHNLAPAEVTDMRKAIDQVNGLISEDPTLGDQFLVGHSYLTPHEENQEEPGEWFRQVAQTEIVPLLEEYWFDNPEKLSEARGILKV